MVTIATGGNMVTGVAGYMVTIVADDNMVTGDYKRRSDLTRDNSS